MIIKQVFTIFSINYSQQVEDISKLQSWEGEFISNRGDDGEWKKIPESNMKNRKLEGLRKNTTYSIRIRGKINGIWTVFSSPMEVTTLSRISF